MRGKNETDDDFVIILYIFIHYMKLMLLDYETAMFCHLLVLLKMAAVLYTLFSSCKEYITEHVSYELESCLLNQIPVLCIIGWLL